MYRNAVYNNKNKSISLFTWDSRGNRVTQEIDYKPYLYLEDKNGPEKSIYGTSLRKKEFNTLWDRNKFVKDSGVKRIYENLPPYQQFLIDNYYHNCSDPDFGKNELKVMYIDLETYDSKNTGLFSEPEKAEHTINVITCYDSLTKEFTTFGLKPYKSKDTDKKVNYVHCKSEHELLKKFIGHFSSDYPDILSGWFSNSFDIPYLINRITFELDKEWADELSPIGRIWEKMVHVKEGKRIIRTEKRYVIEGISCIDYLELYKKFMVGKEKHESYKLDYIGEVELGENKLEFEGSFKEFADTDWEKFVSYNIQDVNILVKLDEKKKFINLLKTLSYVGLCGFEKGMETVPLINGAIAVRARRRNEKIPTFVVKANNEEFPGGYVSPPNPGFYENIVSFDANSLYPSIIISVNISPETKIGSIEESGNKILVHHVSGKTFEMTKPKFMEYIKAENAALSSSGFLFSQNKKGIIPEFLDELYSTRKQMKEKMLKVEESMNNPALSKDELSNLKIESQLYDSIQHAMKITLNACYGYTGNAYAPMSDKDLATSVTLTGQAAIKKSKQVFLEFLRGKFPNKTEEELENYYIYSDSDSLYSSLKGFEEEGIYLKDGEEISEDFHKLCGEIEEYLNDGLSKWAAKKLRSINSRFVFKRETICDTGIFLCKKKRYVLHVLDSEGVKVDKFKYTGVDVVNSTMPKKLKPYVKNVIETMLISKSRDKTYDAFTKVYEVFKELDPKDVSIIKGMNGYEEYSRKCSGFSTPKGMPYHLKAAHNHDQVIKQLNLDKKYDKFRSGEKVRLLYLKKPNKFGIDTIGFKSKYPKEFVDEIDIDYEKMFLKQVYNSINRFYEAANWKLRKPNENVKVELDDLFT